MPVSQKAERKVSGNQAKVLGVLAKNKELTSTQIAEKTGIKRGKRLKELFESGLIKTEVYEGQAGHYHQITAAGCKELEKFNKEVKAKAAKKE